MGKPQNEPEGKNYFKEIHFLYEILNDLKSLDEVKAFLKDILTTSEIRMMKKRWYIASMLQTGLDIRTIAQETNSSTQTVGKIKKVLEEGHGGLRHALIRMNDKIKKGSGKRKPQGSLHAKSWLNIKE